MILKLNGRTTFFTQSCQITLHILSCSLVASSVYFDFLSTHSQIISLYCCYYLNSLCIHSILGFVSVSDAISGYVCTVQYLISHTPNALEHWIEPFIINLKQ